VRGKTEFAADAPQLRPDPLRMIAQGLRHIAVGTDRDLAPAENTRLLECDLLARGTQVSDMINIDTGHHNRHRTHSPHRRRRGHLEDSDIDLVRNETLHGRQRTNSK
jgi:hypothetical protein